MSTLLATRPADHYEPIPTTTTAQRPPETAIEYDAPVLLIRKGRSESVYDLAEFPCGFDGRAFALIPDAGDDLYHVFVARNGQDSTCSCAGFTYTSDQPTGGRCKHLDSIKALVDCGLLDDPRGGAPVEPWPSPEQLAADAGVELPY